MEALRENRTLTRLEVGYSGLGEEACLRLSEVLLSSGSGIRFVPGRTFPARSDPLFVGVGSSSSYTILEPTKGASSKFPPMHPAPPILTQSYACIKYK